GVGGGSDDGGTAGGAGDGAMSGVTDRRRGVSLVVSLALVLGMNVASVNGGQAAGVARPGQSPLSIGHDPLGCVTTDMAPLVDAQVAPPPRFDRGYVDSRAAGPQGFCDLSMKGV